MNKSWISILFISVLFLIGNTVYSQSVFDKDIVGLDQITENREYQIEIKETFFKASIENILIDESQKNSFRHYFKTNKETYKNLLKEFIKQENGKMSGLGLKEKLNEISSQLIHDFLKAEKSGEFSMGNFKFIKNLQDHYTRNNGEHDHTDGAGEPCNNPDMETCDFTGWDLTQGEVDANAYGYVNVNAVSAPGSTGPTSASDQHFIVTGGNDPVIPSIPRINPNGGGGCTAQLGDGTGTGGRAASMSQTFLVDINSANFTYSYAAVMQDPNSPPHTLGEKPFFKARVYDENGAEIICGRYNATAGGGDTTWTTSGSIQYKDWTTVFVPLQAYIGTNVRVEFTTGDCSQSGHYGYAYVEASCSAGEILGPDTITCLGPIEISAPAGADSYLWNTGETTQSITVSTPGTYDVDVIPVTGPACAINFTKEIYEFIDTVEAVFSATPDTICAGQSISFNESSTYSGIGNISSWEWDFDGDGTMDVSTQNPSSQVYNTPGTYDVNLSVITSGGCVDDTIVQVVVTPNATADFTAPPVCEGATSVFTNASTPGAIVANWEWDFDGDGNVDDTSQNPTNTFGVGTHPVRLTVSDAVGNCGHDTIINVVVNPNPVADFTVNDTCFTMANVFTDNSSVTSGAITNWDWDFDNNGTVDNTTQNPSNTYAASGTYTVELIVTTDNTCRDTVSFNVDVFDNPVANFTSDTVCENATTTLNDASASGSGTINAWDWDFDNNGTSDDNNQNTTNNFGTAGAYPVNLSVVDDNGCFHDTTINVVVSPNPTAAFTFSDECFGSATDFTDQSNGNGGTIDTWNWDFTNNGTVDNTAQNPSNGYPAAGNYTAELYVETTNGCKDSSTVLIDVDAIPVANFGATQECLGDATTFTDSSTVNNSNVDQWSWDFGDASGTSVAQNPTYTYTTSGTFNVTLTATSDSGCINTVILPVQVSDNPVANFVSDTACNTFATSFTDITVGTVGIETWDWDFDNNGTSDDGNQDPTFTFAAAGTYPVNLLVTDSFGCFHDTTLNVTVSENPIAAFTFSDECFGTATGFTDQSNDNGGTTPIDSWEWDFEDDGSIDDTNQNPTNLYGQEGVFTAELLVTSTLGCKDSTTVTVDVDAIPVANFGGTNECLGNITSFTDSSSTSIGNVNQWDWDFGDGSPIDNNQHPTHPYTSSGIHNVTLTVQTDSGCTHTFNTNVEVYDNPVANFVSDTACNTFATSFTDITVGTVGIETWDWDFDNNGTSDDGNQDPTFTFAAAGTYPVNLLVTDSFGCFHDTTLNVTVSENPIAAFTFSDECFGTATGFTDQSNDNGGTTPIDSWEWDFEDDGSIDDTNQNPTNLYGQEGVFTAELLVTSTLGCKDSTTVTVDVDAIPVANFGGTNECLGNITSFTDSSSTSIGNVNQWDWDFGDGSPIDNNQHPTHPYTSSGIHNVTLTVQTDSGCTHTFNTNVEVYSNPIADFRPDTVCNSDLSNFTDMTALGNYGIATWDWDFDNNGTSDDGNQNPSYAFSAAGTYPVNLSVVDSFGCAHDTTINVTVSENPLADFSFSNECFGTATTFTNLSSDNGGTTVVDQWDWDFDGDGVIDNSTENPSFVYPSAGTYNTELFITSSLGCLDSITVPVTVDPIPVAHFGIENVCLNTEGTFNDSSTVATGTILNWDWDFGDASGTSAVPSPSYTYTNAGIYNVTLTVTSDSGCTHSETIAVEIYPNPTADFDTTDVCLNLAAQFTDQSVGNGGTIDSWSWDFENDGTEDDSNQNTSHLYPADGVYTIELIVSTASNCSDTTTKTVTIHPMPTADFNFVNSCYMDSVTFADNSNVTSGTIDQWQWDLGNSTGSNSQNPSEVYASEGLYDVELIVTTNNNCSDTIVKTGIEVWPLPVVDFIPDEVCLNAATQFEDQSTISTTYTANTNDQWAWDFGDGMGSSNVQHPIYSYTAEGIYNATLIVTTNHNCVDSVIIPVTVHPNPVVDFVGDTLESCTPRCVEFTDMTVLTMDAIQSWEWDFDGDGFTDSESANPSFCFTNPSNSSVMDFDISLIVTSDFGCVNSITKPSYVHSYPIPNASFTFIPEPEDATIVDKEFTFTDQSIIASTWNWDFGDGSTSTVNNPVHEYPDTGFYLVTLNIENEYGCTDVTSKWIRINPIYAIWIPNAFSPDGNGTNDYFYVDGYGIKELQVQIYDRWGLKIYDNVGVDQTWDGYYKGEIVQTDVYVYKVRAKDVFDEWHDYIGKVTVVK